MSHVNVTPMDMSWHVRMRHGANMNEACHIYHMNEAWHSLSYVRHDSFICVIWLMHTCDMPHSHARHASFIRVPWLFHICDVIRLFVRSYVRHHSRIWMGRVKHMNELFARRSACEASLLHAYVPWLIYMCVTWPVSMCVYMNESFAPRNACAASLAHVQHASFIRVRHQRVRHP